MIYKVELKVNHRKRKGRFPYVRYCHLQVSKQCEITFKTLSRRTRVCATCMKYLEKIKVTLGRYNTMTKPEFQYDESIEWETINEGLYTYTEDDPVVDPNGQLIGHNKRQVTSKITREILEANLTDKIDLRSKELKKLEDVKSKIKKIGHKPEMTERLRILKQQLQDINKIEMLRQHEDEMKTIQEEIDRYDVFITKRQKTLQTPLKLKDKNAKS